MEKINFNLFDFSQKKTADQAGVRETPDEFWGGINLKDLLLTEPSYFVKPKLTMH
jgi:hypothetical protein